MAETEKAVRDAMHGIKSLEKSCGKYDDWSVGVTMEMLEKHIPKKPIKARVYYTKTFCPCCDTVVEYKTQANYYCDMCGQRLDWEGMTDVKR